MNKQYVDVITDATSQNAKRFDSIYTLNEHSI